MTAQIIDLFDRLMAKRMTDAEVAAEAAGQLPATDKLSDRELQFGHEAVFAGGEGLGLAGTVGTWDKGGGGGAGVVAAPASGRHLD